MAPPATAECLLVYCHRPSRVPVTVIEKPITASVNCALTNPSQHSCSWWPTFSSPVPPDGHKETQTTVVWSCLPFIRSGQNHLTRHIERGKKTRQTEEEVGRQHQGMDRPGVWQVPEGSGEQGKMEKTGCESSVVPQRPSRLMDS